MSNTTELFETIKHDLASVKQMYTLCDEYLRTTEPDENYPYFKGQLDTRIAEYKLAYQQTKPNTLIDTLVITSYKYDYKECKNCNETISNISCYINGIHVSIDVSLNDKYRMNNYVITISNNSDKDIVINKYQADLQYFNNRTDLAKYNWLVAELGKTGHNTLEFCVVLQALCS
jgi:hypothetical protein